MRFRGKRGTPRREITMPLLFFPIGEYRPAPDLGDERVRAAFERGAGSTSPTAEQVDAWSEEERAAYRAGTASRSSRPTAPAPWPVEALLIAAETTVRAYGQSVPRGQQRLRAGVAAIIVMWPLTRWRAAMERRRGEQLGLTAEIAPRASADFLTPLAAGVTAGVVRLRGAKLRESPWPTQLARSIIIQVNRRRSFNRALAVARARRVA